MDSPQNPIEMSAYGWMWGDIEYAGTGEDVDVVVAWICKMAGTTHMSLDTAFSALRCITRTPNDLMGFIADAQARRDVTNILLSSSYGI